MGICGLGVDLVEVPRIKHLVEKWSDRFLERVFTDREIDYCLSNRRRYEHLSGRFAVKEAIIKAIGRKIPWKSIEVDSEPGGKPFARVSAQESGLPRVGKIHISITHTERYALAIALLEDKTE